MNRFVDMSPPVAASLKAGSPVVVLETGGFARLPYPQSVRALSDAEQVFWQKGCVPCSVAVVNGRIKAGLTAQDVETVLKSGIACSRSALPVTAARGLSAAAQPSAALAIARLIGVVPVVIPSFLGETEDIDALALYGRLAFCTRLTEDVRSLLKVRSIPVAEEDANILSDAWLIQQELEAPESLVCESGSAINTLCAAGCDAALALKKKTDYII